MSTMGISAAFEQVAQDVRFATRNMRKAPGFTASAIVSLALGIGATTALFSVIYGVILQPFPYAHPENLYSFRVNQPDRNFYFYPESPEDYLDIAGQNHVFSGVIASTISDVFWTGSGNAQRLRGNFVTVNTFDVMGVAPLIGRTIGATDGDPSAQPAVVLGYKFWMRQFGGDKTVLGRMLRLNDKNRMVVGVMPKRFMWRGADVYLPIVFQRGRAVEDVHEAFFIGRLKPNVTIQRAETDLHPILEEMIQRRRGARVNTFRVELKNFYETFPSNIRQSLWILFGAVGVLLLIACINVSSLMLARAAARARELAIRASLGATRVRIVCQLLTESVLIGAGAGVLGVLLAYGGLRGILAIVPPNTIPDESDVALNIPVLLFTVGISLLAALLFGVTPAWHAARTNFAETLKSAGRGMSGAFHETRIRNVFVIAEVALAALLLVGASLVGRTLLQLEQIHFGVQPDHILTMDLPLPERRYPTMESRNAFFRQLLERTRAIPGVQNVELNSFVHPFANFGSKIKVPGSSTGQQSDAVVSQVSHGYANLMGLRLLKGHAITRDDVQSARHVALINKKFEALYFQRRPTIGMAVELVDLHEPPQKLGDDSFSVIGVVGDMRNLGLREETMPEIYIPYTTTGYLASGDATLLATARFPVTELIKPIETQLRSIDPDQPAMEVRTMQAALDAWGFSEPRFSVFLFGVFATLGLLLAAVGIYAVINYSVVRQTQEIGVRMALGARRTLVLRMVVQAGMKLLAIGMSIGLLASFALTNLLRSMIWGVSPFDPLSFLSVIVVLSLIGFLACVVPAVRASRIDPMTALRCD